MKLAVLALLLTGASCSERGTPEVKRDEVDRVRRVIEPPSRGVRALPPYAIRADGVGPYKLGASARELLDQLPSGPRITQFTIPGIVHRDILRAEADAILIGAEPQGKATFVAVVRDEIARTEAGIHIGSTRKEVIDALGKLVEEPDRARDPRSFVPSGLKTARLVLEGDRVIALVIAPEDRIPSKEPGEARPDGACTRPAGDPDKRTFGACLTTTGELLRYEADEIALLARETDKPITTVRVPGLVFAAALRNPIDGRDDIVAIVRNDDGNQRSWSLVAYRLAEGKLKWVIEPTQLYQLTASNARWIGAELQNLDLYLELTARADAIEVGGLLTTRLADKKIRDIVVISPVPVPRRRSKPASHDPMDAGVSESAPGERSGAK